MKPNNRPNYFPGYRGLNSDETEKQRQKQPRWNQEDVEKLKEMVEALKEKGAVNWTYVGKQIKRNATSCYNKYILLSEPPFSELEEAKIASWWKKNFQLQYDVNQLVPLLPQHSRRAVLLRLQSITRETSQIQYKMPEEEFRKFEI